MINLNKTQQQQQQISHRQQNSQWNSKIKLGHRPQFLFKSRQECCYLFNCCIASSRPRLLLVGWLLYCVFRDRNWPRAWRRLGSPWLWFQTLTCTQWCDVSTRSSSAHIPFWLKAGMYFILCIWCGVNNRLFFCVFCCVIYFWPLLCLCFVHHVCCVFGLPCLDTIRRYGVPWTQKLMSIQLDWWWCCKI